MLLIIGKKHLLLSRMIRNSLILIVSLLMLSGCQTIDHSHADETELAHQKKLQEELAALSIREDKLTARETAVSARETELVTLFAEVLKQKLVLENAQAQQDLDQKAAASRARENAQNHKIATKTVQVNNNTNPKNNRTVLGGLEHIYLDPPGMNFSARIDTGAQTSSLNALDMVEFERDGQPYIKFNMLDPETGEKIELTRRIRGYVRIKEVNKRESQRRPVVRMRIRLANLDERISFTLVDRSKFRQQVLIGRNLLRDLAIVDVSKRYTTPKFIPDSK
jgi:hypothetical protein